MRLTGLLIGRVLVGVALLAAAIGAALGGSGPVLAPLAGATLAVLLTDRWHKWQKANPMGIAAFVGALGAGFLWAATPWVKTGDGQVIAMSALFLAIASQGVWWAVHGYQEVKPATGRTNRVTVVLLLLLIAAIIGYLVTQL